MGVDKRARSARAKDPAHCHQGLRSSYSLSMSRYFCMASSERKRRAVSVATPTCSAECGKGEGRALKF